jgi:HSP20 family protein
MLNLLHRHPLEIMQREIHEQLSHYASPRQGAWSPRIDIEESDSRFVIVADVPGLGPKDLLVEIVGDVLTLSGTRALDADSSTTELRRERLNGKFARSFRLPTMVKPEDIVAEVKNGVLRLMIPKAGSSSPTEVAIEFH